eukprot:jgi/Phyca11/556489/estExt2_Genewise1Plus.C_PHYCAscaffold_890077
MGVLLAQMSACCKNESINAREFATGPSTDVVHVFQQSSTRVYDPELRRTREVLPVTAQLSYHTGRMELKGMPPDGWAIDVATGHCPCLYNMKYAACVHSLLAMYDRTHDGERERFCYRGPGRDNGQTAGRPMHNKHALDNERR